MDSIQSLGRIVGNAEVMLPGHVLTQDNGVRVEELAGATGLEPAASCVTGRRLQFKPQRLPDITYTSGSLENPGMRRAVCEILEGGERAFLERARRYRLHWGEPRSRPARTSDNGIITRSPEQQEKHGLRS